MKGKCRITATENKLPLYLADVLIIHNSSWSLVI